MFKNIKDSLLGILTEIICAVAFLLIGLGLCTAGFIVIGR